MVKYTYLAREEILKYIDSLHFRTQYVKIIVLDNQECPLRAIEGRATAGSITINGSSAVRRSGSLTLVTKLEESVQSPLDIMYAVTNTETLLSMNKRIQIEIGIENSGLLYPEYDIFWIPLGFFMITSASVSYNNQGIQIQLKLTDKMALLNGELGGIFPSTIVHSPIEEETEDGEIVERGVKIKTLIEYLLKDFGELSPYEYSIEDIPDQVNNLIRWTNSDYKLQIKKQDGEVKEQLSLVGLDAEGYGMGEVIGYTVTDFTYPVEGNKTLDSKAGETVTSVLDKIKNTLGNYEYFFDVNGIFHFREIQNFLNEGSAIDDLTAAIADKYFINIDNSKSAYSFDNSALVTAYNNNPQYTQIKNDYIVWGKQPETEAPIQYHLLLTEVPDPYEQQFWKVKFNTRDKGKTNIIDEALLESAPVSTAFLTEKESYYYINFASSTASDTEKWKFKMYLSAISKGNQKQTPFDKELVNYLPTLYDFSPESQTTFAVKYKRDELQYWLDIVNTKDELLMQTLNIKQFGIENIGRKRKVLNDDDVNCLFKSDNSEVANRMFLEAQPEEEKEGFTYYIIDEPTDIIGAPADFDFWQSVSLGTIENPAYDLLRSSLHEHLSYNNNISITAMPIYHLDVNQRITVNNKESDIHGDYIINSLTIPLTLNGMMTINARQAVERI